MTLAPSSPVSAPGLRRPRASRPPGRRGMVRELARRPLAVISAGYLAAVLVVAVFAAWLAPYRAQDEDLSNVLSGPSAGHWLGTDRLGRDVLSRLMFGSRVTLLGVAEALVVFAVLGIAGGLAAGFLGGWADRVIARLGDLVLALPGIIVLLMVLAVFPGNELAAMIALGLIGSPILLRVVRGSTLVIREELYIKAARLSGLTSIRVVRRHVLPRLAGPVIVQLSLFAATAVLAQAALSFLGLAAPETQGPSWGNMVAEASQVMSQDPWLLVPTGGAIVLTVLALGLLGDALRDVTAGRHLASARGAHRNRPRASQRGAAPTGLTSEEPEANERGGKEVPQSAPEASAREKLASERLLTVQGLTIAFPGDSADVTVVRDVSFDLAAGEALGIVGESGCGKTVTARSLLGLLPGGGRIASGSAMFAGRDLAAMTEQQIRDVRGSMIGLISQEPMSSLDPVFRVGSQLTEVIQRHGGGTRRQARERAGQLLDMVSLPDPERTLRSYPYELSGGMAQRVSIALALAGNPRLLIADEPTTALDVTVQAGILALLGDLRRRLGMAIILITHDWGVLAGLCDRALVMYAGEVVESAGPEDIYRSPRHPYTEGLLAANPRLAPAGSDLPAIPGTVPPPSAWPAGCHFQPRCRYATDECGAGAIPLTALDCGRLTRCIHSDRLAARMAGTR
jgi:peptide/nickel transport system permease protein